MTDEKETPKIIESPVATLAADPDIDKSWDEHFNPPTDSTTDADASAGDEDAEDQIPDEDSEEGVSSAEGEDDKSESDEEEEAEEEVEAKAEKDDVVTEQKEPPPESDIAVNEEEVKNFPVETVLSYKAGGKQREATIRSKGELSPTTVKELTSKFQIADGIQSTLAKERKTWESEKTGYQTEVRSAQLKADERIRYYERERALDEPIEGILNAVRNNPILQQSILQSQEPIIKQILVNEGVEPASIPKDYSRKVLSQTIEAAQRQEQFESEAILNVVDPVFEGFMKSKGFDKKGLSDFIGFAREQGISFNAIRDENGAYLPPETQKTYLERQLKSAFGLAVEAGKVPAKSLDKRERKRASANGGDDVKLKQREAERMKNKNRNLKTSTGSDSSISGGRREVIQNEGEDVVSALARDKSIDAEWAKLNN